MLDDFQKLFITSWDEFVYLRSCGIGVQYFTKDTAMVYNGHYNFAKALLENKRNPVRFRNRRKK